MAAAKQKDKINSLALRRKAMKGKRHSLPLSRRQASMQGLVHGSSSDHALIATPSIRMKSGRFKRGKVRMKKKLFANVTKVNPSGLCFVVDERQRTYGFLLDRVVKYSGENPEDVGLHMGSKVELTLDSGRVVSVLTDVHALDVDP